MKNKTKNLIKVDYYIGEKPSNKRGYELDNFLVHSLQSTIKTKYGSKGVPIPSLGGSKENTLFLMEGCLIQINQKNDINEYKEEGSHYGEIGITLIGESKRNLAKLARNLELPSGKIKKRISNYIDIPDHLF